MPKLSLMGRVSSEIALESNVMGTEEGQRKQQMHDPTQPHQVGENTECCNVDGTGRETKVDLRFLAYQISVHWLWLAVRSKLPLT